MKLTSFFTIFFALITTSLAYNATGPITYLGSKGALLSGGTLSQGLVFVSGTVPSLDGTIVSGGIKNETAQVLNNIATILTSAGTSWSHVLKCTIFLANISDFTAMNEVYGAMLPYPKPARTTVQAGKLPGDFLVEIEAVAVVPFY